MITLNGRPTFEKTISKLKKTSKQKPGPSKAKIVIGGWKLEEDSNGDLRVINFETGQNIVLARREET